MRRCARTPPQPRRLQRSGLPIPPRAPHKDRADVIPPLRLAAVRRLTRSRRIVEFSHDRRMVAQAGLAEPMKVCAGLHAQRLGRKNVVEAPADPPVFPVPIPAELLFTEA